MEMFILFYTHVTIKVFNKILIKSVLLMSDDVLKEIILASFDEIISKIDQHVFYYLYIYFINTQVFSRSCLRILFSRDILRKLFLVKIR